MKKLLLCVFISVLLAVAATATDFSNQQFDMYFDNGNIVVEGTFEAYGSSNENYNVFLATYGQNDITERVELSRNFAVKNGENSVKAEFAMRSDEQKVRAFVLTDDLAPICPDLTGTVKYEYIDWLPSEVSFYDSLSSDKYSKDTSFSKLVKSDEDITVAEAVAIASNLHAKYNNATIPETDKEYLHVIEMDDASNYGSNGISITNVSGGIDEANGCFVGTSTLRDTGGYDPQISIEGLALDSSKYNIITVRMKLETVSGGITTFKNKYVQVFFKTSEDTSLSEGKSIKYKMTSHSKAQNWFEFELDMTTNAYWKDVITGIRLDPINGNAKFYVDYVKFSQKETEVEAPWYDKFLSYAYDVGFLKLGDYTASELESTITREDFVCLLVSALGEDAFKTINGSIFALPDVEKNRKNSEIFLMMYRAGITLGVNQNGDFNPDGYVSKSDALTFINRTLVKNNRLSGSIEASWQSSDYKHDYEFNDSSDVGQFEYSNISNRTVSDGSFSFTAQYDPFMVDSSVSIDADKYTKLRVRIKADYQSEPTNEHLRSYEVYFMPEDYDGDLTHYHYYEQATDYYLDAAGWYVFEVDLCLHPSWKGNISYFRFDPMNSAGNYTIDYIRFIKSEYSDYPDSESLINAGYTATRLFKDEGFERGFYVGKVDQSVSSIEHGIFNDYCETDESPLWQIAPWWQGTGDGIIDLYENRDTTTDKYTLADTYGINTIVYNPDIKSISQRLDATKIYNGQPHDVNTYKWWPHQLLEQAKALTGEVDPDRNSADADRVFVELDVRMTDFKNTTNPQGTNACQYLVYFYLQCKEFPSHKIWFGLTVFNSYASPEDPIGLSAPINLKPAWSLDSASNQFIYNIPQAVVFDGIENSFNPSKGVAAVGQEWKHISLDVTEHIDRALEWANRDNIFGLEVSKEDMCFDGVNIGYEIHGNYDCTFEFKNFNLVSYSK